MVMFRPPTFAGSGGLAATTGVGSAAKNVQRPKLPLGTPFSTDPNVLDYEATKRRLTTRSNLLNLSAPNNPYRQAVSAADFEALNAEMGLAPVRQQGYGARQRLLAASRAGDAYSRTSLAADEADINARAAASGRIRAASQDVGDLAATALERQYRDTVDSRTYDRLGVSRPVEVMAPRGAVLPPGVRAAVRTNASYITDEEEAAEEARQTAAGLRGITAKRFGLDVTDAGRAVTEAGINLDIAEEGVTRAKQKGSLARLVMGEERNRLSYEDDLAELAGLEADLPSGAGMVKYTDENGIGSWVTPGEAERLRYERQEALAEQRLPRTIQVAQRRQQAQTQAEAQGSPLAGLNAADMTTYLASGLSPERLTQIRAELIRRYTYQGFSPEAATERAEIETQQILEAARKKIEQSKPTPGGYTTQ